jgi:hypothetical protein
VPATCPYPEPDQSSPSPPSPPISHFLKIHLNIIQPSTPESFKLSPSLRFHHHYPNATLLSPVRATYPAFPFLLDLITRVIFGERYKSLSSSLCIFLHFHVTSSLLGQSILLSTLFSNALSLHSSHNVSDHCSHPCKLTGKIIVLKI